MTFVVSASVVSMWLTEFKVCFYHAVHFQYSAVEIAGDDSTCMIEIAGDDTTCMIEIAGDDTTCMIRTEHDNSFGPVLTGVAYRHIFHYKV